MSGRAAAELTEFAARSGFALPEAAVDRICRFVDLLTDWNRTHRLTGDRDRELLLRKHCADSLVLSALIGGGDQVVDVGSGGGFPGLVLACSRADARFVLVEPKRKAVSFLEHAAAQLALSHVTVLGRTVGEVAGDVAWRQSADLVVSRALAADVVTAPARVLLQAGGCLVRMDSGRSAEGPDADGFELAETREYALPTGENRKLAIFRAR